MEPKNMRAANFEAARTFIYTHARLLDRYLFAALFDGGSSQAVIDALQAYQNPDGGFGNALEPDLRTPTSQPLAVERALIYMDLDSGFSDSTLPRVCDWLMTVTTLQGRVPFALPGLEGYPHTPWMVADDLSAGTGPGRLNPTASLCGLLLKHGVRNAWVERASAYCWQEIPGFDSTAFHDVMPVVEFLEHVPTQHDRAATELDRIRERVAQPGVVTLDPLAEGYIQSPLDWAPRPDHPLRPIFDNATIQTHLAVLAARQQPDGGWPISWQALSPAAEAEWRGWITIEALCKLKAYR